MEALVAVLGYAFSVHRSVSMYIYIANRQMTPTKVAWEVPRLRAEVGLAIEDEERQYS